MGEVSFFLPESETSEISREEPVNTMKLRMATVFHDSAQIAYLSRGHRSDVYISR